MVPTNLYFISPMGYLYIQMDEPLLQQALIDVFDMIDKF